MKNNIDEFIDDLSGSNETSDEFSPPIIVNRDELILNHDDNDVQENVKDDYKFVRQNLKAIIETNVKGLERLSKVAGESESPRAFEIMGQYMKQMVEANESLINLHKNVKDVTEQEETNSTNQETNNYFVGSTEELLDLIENKDNIKVGQTIEIDNEKE